MIQQWPFCRHPVKACIYILFRLQFSRLENRLEKAWRFKNPRLPTSSVMVLMLKTLLCPASTRSSYCSLYTCVHLQSFLNTLSVPLGPLTGDTSGEGILSIWKVCEDLQVLWVVFFDEFIDYFQNCIVSLVVSPEFKCYLTMVQDVHEGVLLPTQFTPTGQASLLQTARFALCGRYPGQHSESNRTETTTRRPQIHCEFEAFWW